MRISVVIRDTSLSHLYNIASDRGRIIATDKFGQTLLIPLYVKIDYNVKFMFIENIPHCIINDYLQQTLYRRIYVAQMVTSEYPGPIQTTLRRAEAFLLVISACHYNRCIRPDTINTDISSYQYL